MIKIISQRRYRDKVMVTVQFTNKDPIGYRLVLLSRFNTQPIRVIEEGDGLVKRQVIIYMNKHECDFTEIALLGIHKH